MSDAIAAPPVEPALFGGLPGWAVPPVVSWILAEGRLITQPARLTEGVSSSCAVPARRSTA
jgi:hypothetical protein